MACYEKKFLTVYVHYYYKIIKSNDYPSPQITGILLIYLFISIHFDNDISCVLDQQTQLDVSCACWMKQQSTSRNVAPLGYYPDSQPVLLLLLNAACSTKMKQQIPIL